jgi:Lipase (class 3)
MLASVDLEHNFQLSGLWGKVRGVYTYGQPMAVSREDALVCAKRIGPRLFRHVNYNDIIPHLPPLATGDFGHVGREFRYFPPTCWGNKVGDWFETTSSPATQVWFALGAAPFAIADGIVDSYPLLSFVKFSWSILDHNPIRYIDALYKEGRESQRGLRVALQALTADPQLQASSIQTVVDKMD